MFVLFSDDIAKSINVAKMLTFATFLLSLLILLLFIHTTRRDPTELLFAVVFFSTFVILLGFAFPLMIIRSFSRMVSKYAIIDSFTIMSDLGLVSVFHGFGVGISILIFNVTWDLIMVFWTVVASTSGIFVGYVSYRIISSVAKKIDYYELIPNVKNIDIAKIVQILVEGIYASSLVPTALHRSLYIELGQYDNILARLATYEKQIRSAYNRLISAIGGKFYASIDKDKVREILEGTTKEKFLFVASSLAIITIVGIFLYGIIFLKLEISGWIFLLIMLGFLMLFLSIEQKRKERLEEYLKTIGIKLDEERYMIIVDSALALAEAIFDAIEKRINAKLCITGITRELIVEFRTHLKLNKI